METGEIVDVNTKFCELFHHNKDEIVGKTSTEVGFFSEQDRKNYRREFEKSGEVNGMEMILKARNNLGEVKKACLRAKNVVRQILSFSRKAETKQETLNIAPVVTESLKQ